MQQILNKIKKNRQSLMPVSVISLQALLVGVIMSLFYVDATTNVLVFHSVKVLPEAFTAAGLAGIIIFQLLQASHLIAGKWIKYCIQYGFILVGFIGLIVLQFIAYTKFFLFFYFAATIPFTLILLNIIQEVATQMKVSNNYTLGRIVDIAVLSGGVLGSFWALLFKRTNIIPVEYIIVTLLFLIFVLQFLIRDYKSGKISRDENKPVKTIFNYFSVLPSKQVLFVTVMSILFSVVCFSIVDYNFLQTISETFISPIRLSNFLVFFFLISATMVFIFKRFVYLNLIKTFKINKAILFAPLFTLSALVLINLLLLLPGNFETGLSFSLLFLSLLLTRLFVQLLRESFEYYALKLNFVSQEHLSAKNIDTGIYTILTFWSFFFAGMILLIFKAAEIHDLQIRILINLGVAGLWFYVAYLLNKSYNKTNNWLAGELSKEPDSNSGRDKKYQREYDSNSINFLRFVLNYQSSYQPHHFRKIIKQLPDHLKMKLGVSLNSRNFIDERYKGGKHPSKHANHGQPGSFFDTTQAPTGYMIESLTESIANEDRMLAIRMIVENQNSKYINILKLLIRDPEDEVKRQAIAAITKFKNTDLIFEALEYLNHEDYTDLVCDVLVEMGPMSVNPLAVTFNKPSITLKYQSKIIKTIAQIPCEESYNFLIGKFEYPNKTIVYEAAAALQKIGYHPGPGQKELILEAIDKTIGNCAWLLNIIQVLKNEEKAASLYVNLLEEYDYTFELLLMLLEIKFGVKLVEFLKTSRHEDASNEQKEYGIEILSLILDPVLKGKLFPLLHNNTPEEIIYQLQDQYPIPTKSPELMIQEIINIDLGAISKWTKASAILALSQYKEVATSEDIIAQLYNPEPILSETAIYAVKKWGKHVIHDMESRIPEKLMPKLTLLADNIDLNKYFLLNEKILYLKKLPYFSPVKGENLLHLADILDGYLLRSKESMSFELGSEEILPLFTSPDGELIISNGENSKKRLPQGNLYGLNLYSGKLKIEALTDSFLYVIKPENLTTIVLNFEDISDALYNYLNDSKI